MPIFIHYYSLYNVFMSQLFTIFLAMLPIAELRGAIPAALGIYHLSAGEAFFYSVLGNMIPIFFILWLLEPLSKFLIGRFKIANKFFNWLFERTRRNNHLNFGRWGDLALAVFVAIPLPFTGAWSGAVAAYVFGIPYQRALTAIFAGVVLAGVIVVLASTGVFSFLRIIL